MPAKTVRDLNQSHLRHLYTSCVVTKFFHASLAWWNGTKKQLRPLEKARNRTLRLICAAFKTTPTVALPDSGNDESDEGT
ncbi:hypothetical protein CVT25_015779 [Psilocybe cyanescens]|uniref:Uncharacterized protein n=1 Tax=Psilocybe cyanescens TaxID=93625 RepID=A0A409XG51_PSICY|nr:hypothetical protein CVT25_015779 [Psilocybe cyanescens]